MENIQLYKDTYYLLKERKQSKIEHIAMAKK
jgi:hypothetical protein